ncbi:MAG: hypothetical protein Q7K26_03835 [bacterium]|nr:hypothetical protein [bacterium]
MTKNITVWIIIALIVGGGVGYVVGGQKVPTAPVTSTSDISQQKVGFQNAMRKLWEDHITWTRLYIVEAAAGLPGANETAARLLKNQEDIGNAVKAYYGEEAGNKLTALLKEHITGAVEILTAAKAGDNKKVEVASAKWYANGDEIAAFLSGANPQNWPLKDMKDGMKMHLDITLAEAVAQLQGKYAESVKDYDKVHEHILELADLLSNGILAQFPDKF